MSSTEEPTTTRFYIEHLLDAWTINPNTNTADGNQPVPVWVPVGSIEIEGGEFGASPRDAFTAWEGEQDTRPPVGTYRVWRHETYGLIAQQYEITERVEREITRVEGPAEQQLKEDLRVASIAALTPAEGQGAA